MRRLQLLKNWVETQFPNQSYTVQPASSDASFRRYFRILFNNINDKPLIVMDAPPQYENCTPFLSVAHLFSAARVHVPAILAENLEQGFLVLSDLGNMTYLQALSDGNHDANDLYCDAVDALIKIQLTSRVGVLPDYDEALLYNELNVFSEWFIAKHLQINLTSSQKGVLDLTFARILQQVLSQPKVFVHRDYHSRNLMVASPNPGIIDFQDAVYGPITYDLVSLFKDAYIRWDEERILDWTIRYWEKARKVGLPVAFDFADFYRDLEWMGVQRHLKVLGIFARLSHRDGKNVYLENMPLVMEYLRKTCERYRELHALLNLLDELDGIEADTKVGYTF